MSRYGGLRLKYAYPGTLGQYVPMPPPGFVFLVASKLQGVGEGPHALNFSDYSGYDEFDYLTDENGALIIVEAT